MASKVLNRKKCPFCNATVNAENYDWHISNVHPKENIVEKESYRGKKPMKQSYPVAISIIIIIVISIITVYLIIPSPKPQQLNHPQTGLTAPDFTVMDTTGEIFSLSTQKGNVVFIDFMKATCSGCQRETRDVLISLYKNFSARAVFISVSISDDDTNAALINFKTSYNSPWQYALGSKEIKDHYAVVETPTEFIVDKDGNIAFFHDGVGDLSVLTNKLSTLVK